MQNEHCSCKLPSLAAALTLLIETARCFAPTIPFPTHVLHLHFLTSKSFFRDYCNYHPAQSRVSGEIAWDLGIRPTHPRGWTWTDVPAWPNRRSVHYNVTASARTRHVRYNQLDAENNKAHKDSRQFLHPESKVRNYKEELLQPFKCWAARRAQRKGRLAQGFTDTWFGAPVSISHDPRLCRIQVKLHSLSG